MNTSPVMSPKMPGIDSEMSEVGHVKMEAKMKRAKEKVSFRPTGRVSNGTAEGSKNAL